MAPARERIGDMLVSAGLISPSELTEALSAQKESGLRLGKQLVELGHVGEMQLTQVLSNQLSIPWVSLDRVEFSTSLLERVSGELADRLTVMPIYVRSVRDQGDTLYVAMDDPTDEEAIQQVAHAAQLPVRPMIAAPTELRRAIEARYFGGDESSQGQSLPAASIAELTKAKAPVATPSKPTPGEPARGASKVREPRVLPPPPPPRVSRPEGIVAVEQYELPSSPPAKAGRTLTFLDGTRISLPASGRGTQPLDATEVRHVVKAVRRAAADLGLSDAPRWHDVVQVLLDAVTARGVRLTRKEIQEAWARRHAATEDEAD